MNRIKTATPFIMMLMLTALVGCGSDNKETPEAPARVSPVVTETIEKTAISTPVPTATDTPAPEPTEAPQLSEEEIYWQQVLESFGNSKYDLTAALTEPALKDIVNGAYLFGVGINGSTLENQTLNIPEYMAVSKKHFNSCTMTNLMKSGYLLNQAASKANLEAGNGEPAVNFECINPTLQWCKDNDMIMRGHTLVWHAQAPDWFFKEGYDSTKPYVDKDTMLFRMESYIRQVLTHVQTEYPGVIYCWDVVNEAVDPDYGDKESGFLCRKQNEGEDNPWYMTIGPEYVEAAFTFARKYAAPDVKLFYNDFNTYQNGKMQAIYTLCESLKEKKLIDGIGMQGYWGLTYPTQDAISSAIKYFAKLDLEIHITELSVGVDTENEAEFEKQAKYYGNLFYMFRTLDSDFGGPANITAVTVFGLVDHYREGDTTNTRLFDKDYQPKPAFYKIRDVIKNTYK